MILSIMKKTSRLATLGELGEYPLWTKALSLTLKYEWHLLNKPGVDRFTSLAMNEMKEMSVQGIDCWYARVEKARSLLNIQQYPGHLSHSSVGNNISKKVQSCFSRYWLDSVNRVEKNRCACPRDHNKLRTYKTFKGSFLPEPYMEFINNRNQCSFYRDFE